MQPEPTTKPVPLLAGALVLALTAFAFAPGTTGGLVYDDAFLIAGNPEIQQLGNLGRSLARPFWDLSGAAHGSARGLYYRPWVTLAYTLEYHFFGDRPLGYHLVSVALHLLIVALAFAWLVRRVAPGGGPVAGLAAGVGAGLFAWHPTRVESVTWVSGCTDLWMALFVLLALSAWDKLRPRPGAALATLLLLLGFASKETAAAVPVWLALDAWLRHEAGAQRAARLRAAAFACAAMALAFTLRCIFVPLPIDGSGLLPGELVPRVLATLGEFTHAVVWPWPSSIARALIHHAPSGAAVYPASSIALGALVAVLAIAACVLARRRPALRPWLADAALFFLLLGPVLNVVPLKLKPLIAERFLYLPLLGIAALVARAAASWLRGGGERARVLPGHQLASPFRPSEPMIPSSFSSRGRHAPPPPAEQSSPGPPPTRGRFAAHSLDGTNFRAVLLVAVSTPLLMAAAAATVTRSQDFLDEATLWEHEVAVHPHEAFPLRMLAYQRLQVRRLDEGLSLALRGYALAQDDRPMRIALALLAARALAEMTGDGDRRTLRALAELYDGLPALRPARLETANVRVALTLKQSELPLLEDSRGFVIPRALVHARLGRFTQARASLRAFLARHPSDLDCWHALALVEVRAGDMAAAQRALGQALARAPANPLLRSLQVRMTNALALLAHRDADPVRRALAQAQAYLMLSAPGLAAAVLDRALADDPASPVLVSMRAKVEAIDGDFAGARARIAAARSRLPQAGPLWSATLEEIAAAEAQRHPDPR